MSLRPTFSKYSLFPKKIPSSPYLLLGQLRIFLVNLHILYLVSKGLRFSNTEKCEAEVRNGQGREMRAGTAGRDGEDKDEHHHGWYPRSFKEVEHVWKADQVV